MAGVLTEEVPTADDLAADLDSAVRNREIFVLYQPQTSFESGATVAVEALCRWSHPTLGAIPPDTFIPIAEETGTIGALGEVMLEESLTAHEEWHAAGAHLEISVNVSPLQLADEGFTARLTAEVHRRSLPPGCVTIEITESRPLTNTRATIARLRRLAAAGVGVSLDDYGSGHASLEQLASLPLTEVKLDGTLIRDSRHRTEEELRDAVHLARERGLRVVAEGIETLTHLARAASLHCDRAQGFLIGPPRPRSDIDLIARR